MDEGPAPDIHVTHSGVGGLVLALVLAVGSFGTVPGPGPTPALAHSRDPAEELLVAASSEAATAAGLEVLGEAGFGWTLVAVPDGFRTNDGEVVGEIATLAGVPVEPNQVYELAEEPLFPDQWSLENTGQTGGTADADIDVLAAWTSTMGSPDVVIAVLDTGAALAHPDLSLNLWVNSDEIDGNGIDDDGNGYVDDVSGWDAVGGDADPSDGHGHGTFVATTAAASVNDVGMVGAAPGVAVMPVRVCDDSGGCPLSEIITGLDYALANGADVANLSFGGDLSSAALEGAVRALIDAGMVVVAAAGNDARNNDLVPYFPASFDIDGLISVAASDHNDDLASFSNHGVTSVDLAAPGADVVGGALPNSWDLGSGTSFSAPLVTGVAALIRTVRPDLAPASVEDVVLASVDSLSSLSGLVASEGRLNAGSAMVLATTPVAVASASPADGVLPVTVHLIGSQSFDPLGQIVGWSWELPDGSVVESPDSEWRPSRPGSYQATLTVVDDDDLSESATVFFNVRLRPGGTFVDDNGHFAERAIEAIAAEAITSGCNPPVNDRFCPLGEVTRGQMAAFLARALGLPPGPDAFGDDEGSVFESAINKLAAAAVTVGCNPPANTRYCPDDPVTRGQMAAFLARAFDLNDGAGADVFSDDDRSVFETAIDKLWFAGITAGCNPPANDRYCPDSPVTRGQMAVFLARVLELSPITPPPPTP